MNRLLIVEGATGKSVVNRKRIRSEYEANTKRTRTQHASIPRASRTRPAYIWLAGGFSREHRGWMDRSQAPTSSRFSAAACPHRCRGARTGRFTDARLRQAHRTASRPGSQRPPLLPDVPVFQAPGRSSARCEPGRPADAHRCCARSNASSSACMATSNDCTKPRPCIACAWATTASCLRRGGVIVIRRIGNRKDVYD